MKEYSTGAIRKRKKSKNSDIWVWEAMLYESENGAKRQLSHVTGIECEPPKPEEKGQRTAPSGRGATRAKEELRKWRETLVENAAKEENASPTAPKNKAAMKVTDYVSYYWDTREIEPETRTNYNYLLKRMNSPILDIPISQLTVSVINDWLKQLRDEGVGQEMKCRTYSQLRSACNFALEENILSKNPCIKSNTPKRAVHEINPLEDEQLLELWEKLDVLYESKPALADITRFALNTGMRIGEICALTFNDITNTQIHVRRVITRNGGKLRIKLYPKNGKARDIDINDEIRAILDRRKTIISEHNQNLTDCYIFAAPFKPKKYPSPAYIGKQFNMFIAFTGIKGVANKPIRFHDLRHTFASQALSEGIDVTTVSAILGHENISTTLNYYARWLPSTRAKSMVKIGKAINKRE